mmetsp:Transcript_47581/g.94393  ORF Transcript_47581/g.94393 Transcript_47581/m.94393 type:complete len:246 (+) Transcript_47581:359-1096(+)
MTPAMSLGLSGTTTRFALVIMVAKLSRYCSASLCCTASGAPSSHTAFATARRESADVSAARRVRLASASASIKIVSASAVALSRRDSASPWASLMADTRRPSDSLISRCRYPSDSSTSARRTRSALDCLSIASLMLAPTSMSAISYRYTRMPQGSDASSRALAMPKFSLSRSKKSWSSSKFPTSFRIADCASTEIMYSGSSMPYDALYESTTLQYTAPSSETCTLSLVMAVCGWMAMDPSLRDRL